MVAVQFSGRFVLVIGLAMLVLAAQPQDSQASSFGEVKKLTASDALPFDSFGSSVALSGDTALIGAVSKEIQPGVEFDDTFGSDFAGSAYIFERHKSGSASWGEVRKLTSSDAEPNDQLGAGVAIDGDTAILGANLEGDDGAAYIFERDHGGVDNWGEVVKLKASDAEVYDGFGHRVGISGDVAVVGACCEDTGGDLAGAAYVFHRSAVVSNNWGEVAKLLSADIGAYDTFGTSVAVSGETVVVGAFGAGAAYIFERDAGGVDNWGEVATLTPSHTQPFSDFGRVVGLSGDIVVVGAALDDERGDSAGATYIYQRDEAGTDNWGEVKKLSASDVEAGDNFGSQVAVDNSTITVGARHEDSAGNWAGAVYVFQRDEGGLNNWGEVKKLTPSGAEADDRIASSAVSGGLILIGHPRDDTLGTWAGAAHVFQGLEPVITPTQQPTALPAYTPTPSATSTPLATSTAAVPPTKTTLPPGPTSLPPVGAPSAGGTSYSNVRVLLAASAVFLITCVVILYTRRRVFGG